MASSVLPQRIILKDIDVNGATLVPNLSVQKHSCVQLRRWLSCRGLKTGGSKQVLQERVLACLHNGDAPIVNYIDNGVHYKKKLDENNNRKLKQVGKNAPPIFPIAHWKKFPSQNIPNHFCYGVIYNHIIETAVLLPGPENSDVSDDDKENVQSSTSKPLRKGRRFFLSGHIQNLEDNISNGQYCVKSDVMSSYNDKQFYKTMIMLDNISAMVLDSSCTCHGSSLGRCSHVSGLLFALEDYTITFGFKPPSCTSKLCGWNKGRSKKKDPAMIVEKSYGRKQNPKWMYDFKPDEDVFLDSSETKTSLLSEVEQLHDNSLWRFLLDFEYSCYELTDERIVELQKSVKYMKKSLTLNLKTPGEVPNTKGQSNNENWTLKRKFYITASISKEIFNIAPSRYDKKINELLWKSSTFFSKYTDYGLKHEEEARRTYQHLFSLEVETTGMWINPKYPGLSSSPDGLVWDNTVNQRGLLEIKCPYVLKDYLPTDIDKLSERQKSDFCCYFADNGKLTLKTNHKYYFQIQMSMAILECEWCDFVIYTTNGLDRQRIKFDVEFWNRIFPKLCVFHDVLCVEYFEMRLPRKLSVFVL